MHIGAYDDEPASVAQMDAFLRENGYENDFSNKGKIRKKRQKQRCPNALAGASSFCNNKNQETWECAAKGSRANDRGERGQADGADESRNSISNSGAGMSRQTLRNRRKTAMVKVNIISRVSQNEKFAAHLGSSSSRNSIIPHSSRSNKGKI